jgi:hypothetical protein
VRCAGFQDGCRINTVGDFVRFITLPPRVEEGSCDLTVR